ncbi:hypothetical protein ACFSM5_10120 [Lacibacterium aquatile]|uniref:Uncharacterized protein n=1 Tax=Lacibacterium aquatile TaxID=1168082 RepID=A0ABW5DQ44_9PROT
MDLQNKMFRLWDFHVSHSKLLLRCSEGDGRNIDMMFFGVHYMSLPNFIHGLALDEPTTDDMDRVRAVVGDRVKNSRLYVLCSKGIRHLILADDCIIEENDFGPMETNFRPLQRALGA